MKKIISLILSVIMLCSMFGATSVFAMDDASLMTEFESYITDNGLNFDKNYFFSANFEHDASNKITGTFAMKLTTTSEKDVTLGVGFYYDGKEIIALPALADDYLTSQDVNKVTVNSSVATYIPLDTTYYYDKLLPVTFCATLQDYGVLNKNETVTVEIVSAEYEAKFETNEDGTPDYSQAPTMTCTYGDEAIRSTNLELVAPVSFENSNLKALGKVLTAISLNNELAYDDVVVALNAYALASEISDADKAVLADNFTDEVKVAMADVIASENSGKDVITNSGVVTLPYVALSQVPAVDGTSYVVEAEKVEATEVAPTGKDAVVAYDITIKANDIEVPNPVVAQKVVIDLPNGWNTTGVQYKHGTDDWADAEVVDGKVVFYTDSFSVFTLAGTKVAADEDAAENKADRVEFKLVQDEVNKNKFSVVIAPTDATKQIFKFATAAMEVQFRNDGITEDAMETFTYELKAADGISITNLEDVSIADDAVIGGFTFVATAEDGENLITAGIGEAIVIADLEITGKGKFKVMSDSAEVENVIYTETLEDNEAVEVAVSSNNWSNVFEIPEQKYELTINVDFGLNKIETDDADYLGMTVTLVGSISKEEIVLNVGDELAVTLSADTATATGKIELPAKENYEFVIKGLGYRTFRGNVYLDENKTINLWNNALTSGSVNVIADDDTTAKDVTFLVGDIYMDGIVDIYDLSAATSYYGAENIDKANTNVYACDLNRDGKITIADIAYVQVSYGN